MRFEVGFRLSTVKSYSPDVADGRFDVIDPEREVFRDEICGGDDLDIAFDSDVAEREIWEADACYVGDGLGDEARFDGTSQVIFSLLYGEEAEGPLQKERQYEGDDNGCDDPELVILYCWAPRLIPWAAPDR